MKFSNSFPQFQNRLLLSKLWAWSSLGTRNPSVWFAQKFPWRRDYSGEKLLATSGKINKWQTSSKPSVGLMDEVTNQLWQFWRAEGPRRLGKANGLVLARFDSSNWAKYSALLNVHFSKEEFVTSGYTNRLAPHLPKNTRPYTQKFDVSFSIHLEVW